MEKIKINDLIKELEEASIFTEDVTENKQCVRCIIEHGCEECSFYENCLCAGLTHLMVDKYKIVDNDGTELNII